MTTTRILGRTLTFHRQPRGIDDHTAWTYREDGAILVEDGKIIAVGERSEIRGDHDIDHRPHLILPGFIDPHIHFPQAEMIAAYAGDLMEWLATHTFPAEARFADPDHANAIAPQLFETFLRHGTTTVAAFCSSHPASVDAFFAEAARRDMCVLAGKTMMDREAPASVLDTAERGYDESRGLIERWHGKGRARYAITPRFAITSTEAQLAASRTLATEHPDLHIQTHMDESLGEIARIKELFPNDRDYLSVYERFDLIGPRTLLGHCIHLTDRERGALRETGAVAVHCPTSNLFLGSGLFPLSDLDGVRTAVATDIGGGTSYSMLRTLDEAYKIQQLRGHRLDPMQSFDWATRSNAAALGLEAEIGTLDVGSAADLVVLNAAATPEMALRQGRIESLAEELFLLQTLGDDRAVVETYVAGRSRQAMSQS